MSEEKERYATTGTWAEVFQKEGHVISAQTIRRRLTAADVLGVHGRDRRNRCRRNGFFSETDTRRACADLMNFSLPIADSEGFIYRDGQRYATINVWVKVLNVSEPAIYPRLER